MRNALLAVLLPAALLCACARAPCEQTCSGCCDEAGVCRAGDEAGACGQGGRQCKVCDHLVCMSGACVTVDSFSCDPGTCSGCCAGRACYSGTGRYEDQCGRPGEACQSCSALGAVCRAHQCSVEHLDGGYPPRDAVARSCVRAADCTQLGPSARCLLTTQDERSVFVGGYCSMPCSADSQCPLDSLCVATPGASSGSSCLKACTPLYADCDRPGLTCAHLGADICWTSESVSPSGFPDLLAGRPCQVALDCAAGSKAFCLAPKLPSVRPSGWSEGYCSAVCSAAGDDCGDGGVCVRRNFGDNQFASLCMAQCGQPGAGQGSCRTGYVCEATPGADAGHCAPDCRSVGATCAAGVCQDAGYCR